MRSKYSRIRTASRLCSQNSKDGEQTVSMISRRFIQICQMSRVSEIKEVAHRTNANHAVIFTKFTIFTYPRMCSPLHQESPIQSAKPSLSSNYLPLSLHELNTQARIKHQVPTANHRLTKVPTIPIVASCCSHII